MTRRCKIVVFIDETSWLDCRCDYNVAWMSNFHVLITLITRRCEDVGFGCRFDFNVVATRNVHVLVTSMTRRRENVVFMSCDVATYLQLIINVTHCLGRPDQGILLVHLLYMNIPLII